MDNLCHTLVGAACSEAGLKGRTRFASATLMIAANLPDLDVLVFATRVPSMSFRRGWTHGVLGDLLLPVILTGVMMAIDRARPRRDATVAPASTRASWPALLALSYIGVASHLVLDLLNNYGVRLLMPLSNRWFYGDTLFIVDPWMWAALGGGVWLARRRGRARPARLALVVATAYIVVMLVSARSARSLVLEAWRGEHGSDPRAAMVGPVFLDPFRKDVIVDGGDGYVRGTFRWLPRSVRFDDVVIPSRARTPEAESAQRDPGVRAFLVWARFPYYEIETARSGTRVVVSDMRFGRLIATTSVTVSPSSP